VLLESGVDDDAAVYNYALCHDCGVVYARRRPVGARYEYLLERFEITLGRAQDGIQRPGHVALRSGELTEEEKAALRERVAKGVFVSEHAGLKRRDYLPALLQDRLANSVHVELIGSLLSPNAPRVLELRPRLGSIGAGLRRLYNADVYGMPLFDSQQFLIGETYGIPADHRVEYDHFCIPYEGQFDLVVANHMLTHSLRPREFLATVRERLKPGGHIYLYNEPDERDFLEGGKSMVNTLNAFHVQTFDGPSLVRALTANGFEAVFVTHHAGNLLALARACPSNGAWPHMTREERDHRVAAYQKARDAAILRLPERLRPLFANEWEAIVERSFAAGLIDYDEGGRLRIVKGEHSEEPHA
jgi:SAM-dependent methyltransferase